MHAFVCEVYPCICICICVARVNKAAYFSYSLCHYKTLANQHKNVVHKMEKKELKLLLSNAAATE